MQTDKISVIIPVYNTGAYLKRCLDSLICQTYTNLEFILVNDGSSDNSGEICSEYAQKDQRIRVVHQENKGVSAARNRGLDLSVGKYIGFMDSDDYVDPHMYEALYCLLTSQATDVAVCNFYNGENDFSPYYQGKGLNTFGREEAISNLLTNTCYTCSLCTKLFRAEKLKALRFDTSIAHNEDLLYSYQVLKNCTSVVFTARSYYYYCNNTGSAVHSAFDKKKMGIVRVNQLVLQDIRRAMPQLLPVAKKEFVRNHINCAQLAAKSYYRDRADLKLIQQNVRKYLGFYLKSSAANGYKVYAVLISVSLRLFQAIIRKRGGMTR